MEEENAIYNNGEDSLEVATKTWNKAISAASKTGYREGKEDGSQSVFQEGFDVGYQQAFKLAFSIGAYKGLASCLPKDLKHPTEIENILSNSKSEDCYLCGKETEETTDVFEKPLADLEVCQAEHPKRTLQVLKTYLDPLLKEYHIKLST